MFLLLVLKKNVSLLPDDGVVSLIFSEKVFFVLFSALSVKNVNFNLLFFHIFQLSMKVFFSLLSSLHFGIKVESFFRLLHASVFDLLFQILNLFTHSFLLVFELLFLKYSIRTLCSTKGLNLSVIPSDFEQGIKNLFFQQKWIVDLLSPAVRSSHNLDILSLLI